MTSPDGGNSSPHAKLISHVFEDLLDCIVVDVASECHRIARLGLDRNLEDEEKEMRLSAEARMQVADPSSGGEPNGKYVSDIFGQTHPAVADEIFECMNCGRSIMAGRFAPHLEKCMGKGRKARQRATRSCTITKGRHSRVSPVSVYAPYSNSNTRRRRHHNETSGVGEDYSESSFEEP